MTGVIVPSDAASLVLVRRDAGEPRILMGRRSGGHVFMPEKWVFPGGRVDLTDVDIPAARELPPDVATQLAHTISPPDAPQLARALALAAVRETFEETGLIIGAPITEALRDPLPESWEAFTRLGYLPDLSGLHYLGRAITPEQGFSRRYDARFLLADAASLVSTDAVDSDELLDLDWFTFSECRANDLAPITHWVIDRTETFLRADASAIPEPFDLRHI